MTRERWIQIGSIAAALGGLSWLAKIAIIIATEGKVNDEGAAALFYILGVALMAIGSTAVGVRLANRRSSLLLIGAVVLSPVVFFVSSSVLDGIAKPLLENRGPAYWEDEAGIVVTALIWLLLGITLLRDTLRSGGTGFIAREHESADSATVAVP